MGRRKHYLFKIKGHKNWEKNHSVASILPGGSMRLISKLQAGWFLKALLTLSLV